MKKSTPKAKVKPKTKKTVKKPIKLKFFLLDNDGSYSFWTEEELKSIPFQELCELALENSIELHSNIMEEALSGEDFIIDDVEVSKEIESALFNLYKLFPTIKFYVDQRQNLMKLNFIKA